MRVGSRGGSLGSAPAGLLAVAACTSPLTLEDVPDVSTRESAIMVVTREGAVARVVGYDPPPPLDQVAARDGETIHAFLYDRPLADLGLVMPLSLAAAGDERAVGLPAAAVELRLALGDDARWAPIDVRPRAIDELRLRGATVEICARLGGCFADAAAAERLDCDLACADRIAFEVRPPRLPRLDATAACRAGWRAEERALDLDPLLAEVGTRVDVRLCSPPPDVECSPGTHQPALALECSALAACGAAAQAARLPQSGPVAYVPSAQSGGPAGPAFPSLLAAVAGVEAGTTIALGPGAWTLGAGGAGLALVGRCPEQTVVEVAAGDGGSNVEGLSVSGLTLRLAPTAGAPLRARDWTAAQTRVVLTAAGRLVVEGGRLEGVRVETEAGAEAIVELSGAAEVRSADLARVDLVIADRASVRMDDVRVRARAEATALDVRGRLDASDLLVARGGPFAARVGPGAELVGRGLAMLGEAVVRPDRTEGAARLDVEGQVQLAASRLENVDVRAEGASAGLALDDSTVLRRRSRDAGLVRVDAGGAVELTRVAVERTRVVGRGAEVVVRDLVAWGDEIVRVDPRTPEELDLGTPFVALVVDGGSLDLERAAFSDVPAAVAGRRAFDARLVDLTVSRSTCEPFAFGPGPVRRGLDLGLRDGRRCEGVLYPQSYGYPHAPEDYLASFSVRLDGVWARSAGLAGPFRNELQVVGTGRFSARDVRFVRTTSRGLLAQGDVRLDVERASFENPGVQGACFFPAIRLEPTPDLGFGAANPSGTLDRVRSLDMDVGYVQLVLPDVEPDVEIRGLTVQGARQGIVRARASDRTFGVPLDLGDFLVGNAFLDIEDDLQGPTPNQSCD